MMWTESVCSCYCSHHCCRRQLTNNFQVVYFQHPLCCKSSCLLAWGNYAVRVEHFLSAICPASDGFVVHCRPMCSLVTSWLCDETRMWRVDRWRVNRVTRWSCDNLTDELTGSRGCHERSMHIMESEKWAATASLMHFSLLSPWDWDQHARWYLEPAAGDTSTGLTASNRALGPAVVLQSSQLPPALLLVIKYTDQWQRYTSIIWNM